MCLDEKYLLIVGNFRGGEVWFKTGILNSGLIFMGLFFGLCGLFRSEFGGERCSRSWLVVWGCLFKGLVERWFWDWWWWCLGGERVEVLCNFSDFGSFWVFFKLSDNLFYIVVKGYFGGVSKWLSKSI